MHCGGNHIAISGPDQDDTVGQLTKHRHVAGEDPEITIERARNHHRCLTGPHRTIGCDHLYLQCHCTVSFTIVWSRRSGELSSLTLDVVDATAHEERLLWQVVKLTIGDRVE